MVATRYLDVNILFTGLVDTLHSVRQLANGSKTLKVLLLENMYF